MIVVFLGLLLQLGARVVELPASEQPYRSSSARAPPRRQLLAHSKPPTWGNAARENGSR